MRPYFRGGTFGGGWLTGSFTQQKWPACFTSDEMRWPMICGYLHCHRMKCRGDRPSYEKNPPTNTANTSPKTSMSPENSGWKTPRFFWNGPFFWGHVSFQGVLFGGGLSMYSKVDNVWLIPVSRQKKNTKGVGWRGLWVNARQIRFLTCFIT